MRHNDYPATLLMEPAANDEPARYRMTPAASTVRAMRDEPTSAELACEMAYFVDCVAFERGTHYPGSPWIGVGHGAPAGDVVYWYDEAAEIKPEAWAKLTSTEGATAGAGLIGYDTSQPAEDWKSGPPPVPGVYIATRVEQSGNKGHRCRWLGSVWTGTWWGDNEPAHWHTEYRHPAEKIKWLRLIEADTPAAPAAQEGVKPRIVRSSRHLWNILGLRAHAMQFVCDADGWIPHQPTADAVCPVPEGIKFDARWCDGELLLNATTPFRQAITWRSRFDMDPALVAWRPVVQS